MKRLLMPIQKPLRPVLLALAAVLAGAPLAPGIAQPPPSAAQNPPGTHTLNLKDADIQALIATVSEITGRNFIVAPNVQGKVTVVSAKPMKPDEIYDVFLSVLRVHGYAAVSAGSMVKIVPEALAQPEAGTAAPGSADEVVTQIVPVRHVSAAELVAILRPLLPQGAQVVAHDGSNALIVSDRASSVARLAGIVARIDTTADAEIEVIPLQHANAAELARTLSLLADDKTAQATGENARVLADERTNSILLAGGKSGRLRMRALITHLDTPLDNGGATNVIYLRYAKAKDLVPILQGVAASLGEGSAPRAQAASPGGAAAATAPAGTTIQAHEETNALVVSAPPAVFRSIESVVRALDVRRAQVLIEAIVAEVADEAAREIGIQWQAPFKQNADGSFDHGVVGGTNFTGTNGQGNILNAGSNPLSLGGGLNLGYVSGTVTLPGSDTPLLQIGALLRALQGDGRSNILSTPSVLTLDNQQAVIKVAQEVPFLTGQYTNTSTNGGSNQPTNPFQTIERKDVGLTLKVTPHVNEGDSVRLDLHQEVSSLAPSVQGAVDLVTNKREIETSVLVADDATLVLGGLIDQNVKDTVQKVPALGDIPLLGNLFRYRNNNRSKRDLMVFLHPKILRDAASEAALSNEKYNYMRTRQLDMRQTRELLTPKAQQPLLPETHDFLADPKGPARPARAGDGR